MIEQKIVLVPDARYLTHFYGSKGFPKTHRAWRSCLGFAWSGTDLQIVQPLIAQLFARLSQDLGPGVVDGDTGVDRWSYRVQATQEIFHTSDWKGADFAPLAPVADELRVKGMIAFTHSQDFVRYKKIYPL